MTGTANLIDVSSNAFEVQDLDIFERWYINKSYTHEVMIIDADAIKNKIIYAKYNVQEFSIAYHADGSTHQNPKIYTKITNGIAFLPAIKEGYTFRGWYTDVNYQTELKEIKMGTEGNLELYAEMTPNYYSLTYHTNGGVNPNNAAVYSKETPSITLGDATREGFVFEGWFKCSFRLKLD